MQTENEHARLRFPPPMLFLGFLIGACSVLCTARSDAPAGLTLPALALGPIVEHLLMTGSGVLY